MQAKYPLGYPRPEYAALAALLLLPGPGPAVAQDVGWRGTALRRARSRPAGEEVRRLTTTNIGEIGGQGSRITSAAETTVNAVPVCAAEGIRPNHRFSGNLANPDLDPALPPTRVRRPMRPYLVRCRRGRRMRAATGQWLRDRSHRHGAPGPGRLVRPGSTPRPQRRSRTRPPTSPTAARRQARCKPIGDAVTGEALTEVTIEMIETTEVPVVGKSVKVREEVVVRRECTSRVATVRDTVRRDKIEVTRSDEKRRAIASGRK